ncbi:CubicO group peptidase, beta-lactamase class C family [Chitinophaga sp. CF118]|uniref:serine hydrolase domain-containing protein n=1 Tax=Chitinophaga sp. CF118 TaxID=1884367 RepID=UPI0008DF3F43|nr:serine hydrolase domain-containing protein [Chitinophaga sp. CF118]SFD98968.1 CubicO group peptidase, beta-lactamase class C family [Chitinophaga sp. CF118]
MKKISLILICSFIIFHANAQLPDSIQNIIEKEMATFMNTNGAVGLSIGIYKNGYSYTYHAGTTEKGTLHTPDDHTFYSIASLSKTFTGLLLAQAVTENKVKLDDDIRKYIEGDYPNLQYNGQPIKLYHLISHVSRLPFFLSDSADKPGYTRDNFLKDLHNIKLDTLPGIKFQYSNAAAQLLGYILEKVYNKPYEELLKIKIVRPLSLKNTKITLTATDKKHAAKGYNKDGSYNSESYNYLQAAGGIKSSVGDLLKYIEYQLDEKDSAVALSHKESWGFEMGNNTRFSCALNWQIIKSANGMRRIFQDGNLPNYSSLVIMYPELKTGIVLLSNTILPHELSKMADTILKGVTLE